MHSDNRPTVLYLGGSNGLARKGLTYSLSTSPDYRLINTSIGNTSSCQNLYSLIEYQGHVDIIVHESNVNDSYCAHSSRPEECRSAVKHLSSIVIGYYEILSRLDVPVVTILMPLNKKAFFGASSIEPDYLYRHFLELHKYLSAINGFTVFDVASVVNSRLDNVSSIESIRIMPDARHLRPVIAAQIGVQLLELVDRKVLCTSSTPKVVQQQLPARKFKLILAGDLNGECITRENSCFAKTVLSGLVDTPRAGSTIARSCWNLLQEPGYALVGAMAWGETGASISFPGSYDILLNDSLLQFMDCFSPVPLDSHQLVIEGAPCFVGALFMSFESYQECLQLFERTKSEMNSLDREKHMCDGRLDLVFPWLDLDAFLHDQQFTISRTINAEFDFYNKQLINKMIASSGDTEQFTRLAYALIRTVRPWANLLNQDSTIG